MRASRREGQGQRGAVYSEHVNAADRSDANQAALGSQARHRWLRLTRWRWQRLAAWARQLWKVALWPTGESPSVARPRQCRAVGAQHDQAADRSGANQIAGSSQARHQWMPLGPMRAAPPDKAAAARWPPTAAEQQTI